jgi:succinate dehydrogenase/fumarate reductase cytochrome b subunit
VCETEEAEAEAEAEAELGLFCIVTCLVSFLFGLVCHLSSGIWHLPVHPNNYQKKRQRHYIILLLLSCSLLFLFLHGLKTQEACQNQMAFYKGHEHA